VRRKRCRLLELDNFRRTVAPAELVVMALKQLDTIERGSEFLRQTERWNVCERLADHFCAKRTIPVETGSVRLIHDQVGVCHEEISARCKGVSKLMGHIIQLLLSTDIVKHFTAYDQIEASRHRILD